MSLCIHFFPPYTLNYSLSQLALAATLSLFLSSGLLLPDPLTERFYITCVCVFTSKTCVADEVQMKLLTKRNCGTEFCLFHSFILLPEETILLLQDNEVAIYLP